MARRGVRLVIVLVVLASTVSMAAVVGAYLMVYGEPSVPARATLELRIGSMPDTTASDTLTELVGGRRQLTFRQVLESLKKAKSDPRIASVLVVPNGVPEAYWGKLQEVRDAIADFRSSGKPAYAYLEYGGEREYYLATACDRIYLLPTSPLDLTGLATYEVFLRGTLDKIGAYPDLHHIGDYKTAPNQLTETTFTPAHREMSESLTRDLFDQLVRDTAAGRDKGEDDVRQLIDRGPFLAEAARAAGLVDDLAYEDQLDDLVPGAEGTLRRIQGTDYTRVRASSAGLRTGPRMGVIHIGGTIVSGRSGFDPLNGNLSGSETIVEQIRRAGADASLRALIVRVDSPGGSAIASDVIWRELSIARRDMPDRPIVVSMSDLAASGGYYVAMPAHAIVAQPGTLTGSIGIYGGKITTGGLYEKLGMTIETVSAGRHAEMSSPTRPYNESERAKIEEQLQAFYAQFVQKVASARGLTYEQADLVARGRVWTGRQAKEVGLVDELGGLDTAVKVAKDRAEIAEDVEIALVDFLPSRGVLDLLFDRFGQSGYERLAALAPDGVRMAAHLAAPALFRRGEALAWTPFPRLP